MRGFGHESPAPRSMDWLTPKPIIDALGPFDLDPCAAPDPRPWPTAARHVTKAENGLAQAWSGLVWLNPPYGREIREWMRRMADYANGIALVFARTDTEWFQDAARCASAFLFIRGRVQFHLPDGSIPGRAGAPTVLIAFGDEAARRLRACAIPGVIR